MAAESTELCIVFRGLRGSLKLGQLLPHHPSGRDGVTCMDYNETERFLEILIFHVQHSLLVGQYLVLEASISLSLSLSLALYFPKETVKFNNSSDTSGPCTVYSLTVEAVPH